MNLDPNDDLRHRDELGNGDEKGHTHDNFHQPDLTAARFRADSLRKIRDFFFQRHVLEVETPILSRGISLDCHIDVFSAAYHSLGYLRPGNHSQDFYLQTSPEPHLKRLLTQGFPDVYQISKSFRNGEVGRHHNPEFSMLEWYRKGFSLADLMQEVAEVCQLVIGSRKVVTKTYSEVFGEFMDLNPFTFGLEDLKANPHWLKLLPDGFRFATKREALEYLMAHFVEPKFSSTDLTIVHQFPSDQAAQAELIMENPLLAYRFEVYSGGMELGNGYLELLNPLEYEKRFDEENSKRVSVGKPPFPKDKNLLLDLSRGLPPCSGVAMGFDRLLMLGLGVQDIQSVLTFPWTNC